MANIRKGCKKAMQKLWKLKWVIPVIFLGLCGCAAQYVLAPDGEYDFRVPVGKGDSQAGFNRLFVSTVKVMWTPQYAKTFYTHDFTNDRGLRLRIPMDDEKSPTGFRLAGDGIRETVDSYSKIGTALVIARQNAANQYDVGIAITTAHVVTAPDTIRYFMRDGRGLETAVLERISVKIDESLQVVNRDGESIFAKVQQLDKKKDMALLKLNIPNLMTNPLPFLMPLGKLSELEWGNFVYIVGHPRSKMRLTGGTVSLDDQDDRFFVDAEIRAGYSGGPVVAVRDGLPNLELVGICRGATTETFRLLVPHRRLNEGTVLSLDLLDQVSVEERDVVEPGLGFVMGIEAAKGFLLDCRQTIRFELGINFKTDPALKMWGF